MKRGLHFPQKAKVTNKKNKIIFNYRKQNKEKLQGFEDWLSQAVREIWNQPDVLAFQN